MRLIDGRLPYLLVNCNVMRCLHPGSDWIEKKLFFKGLAQYEGYVEQEYRKLVRIDNFCSSHHTYYSNIEL